MKLLKIAERQLYLIDGGNDYELMVFYTEIKERVERYEKLAVIQNERRNKMELKVAFLKLRIAVLNEQIDVLNQQISIQLEQTNKAIEKEICFCCIS